MVIPIILISHSIINRQAAELIKKDIDNAVKVNITIIIDATNISKIEASGFELILRNISYIHDYNIFIFGMKKSVAKSLGVYSIAKKTSSLYTTSIDKILHEIKGWYKNHAK